MTKGKGNRSYNLVDCGLTNYRQNYKYQLELFRRRLDGKGEDTLLVTRHQPTVTMGKSASYEDLLVSREHLKDRDVSLIEVGRGGGITYHGPGQIVLYPLFDLRGYGKDLKEFICRLGTVMGKTAEKFGLETEFREDDKIGLWVRGRKEKLGSIGLKVKRWYTMHGIALNVSLDQEKASLIRPCGISESSLASISDFADVEPGEVKEVLLTEFARAFDRGGGINGA